MWLKICGMTDPAAVAAALEARVDAIGFVFAPSVRRLEPARAAQLAAMARGRALCVAVTLHPEQSLIDQILAEFAPDALQSDLEDLERLRLPAALTRMPVLRDAVPTPQVLPPRLLYEGRRSGSGEAADWQRAMLLAHSTQLILAGGLHAANVAAAIAAVRPFGVDVSSGVESTPGHKSPQRIAEFVQAARAAFAEIEHESHRTPR
jgi:phosphoribosylanthranilate isomerase